MRILIWGTGATAKRIIENGVAGEIVGFVRSYPGPPSFLHRPVFLPNNIAVAYDFIFVAVIGADPICKAAEEAGIDLEKICYLQLPAALADRHTYNLAKAERFLSAENLAIVMACSERDSEHNFILQDLKKYNEQNTRATFNYDEAYRYFIYRDKFLDAGSVKPVFFQDIWVAKLVHEHNPERHFDFGSRANGLIGHLLSFRGNIVRIAEDAEKGKVPGTSVIQGDITNLSAVPNDSIESISVMCPPNQLTAGGGQPKYPDVYAKIFVELRKKMAPKGMVYLSVPVGNGWTGCGAHQIFSAGSVIKAFQDMELVEYSVASGSGLERFVPIDKYASYTGEDQPIGLFCFRERGVLAKCKVSPPDPGPQGYEGRAPLGLYFYQDLWAAKLINRHNPKNHFDIGSNVDGFIGHLLSFREHITLIDIRPLPVQVAGIDFVQADATNLDGIEDNSVESLSALCSLEHFGLGRYGDPIDPEACFKAFQAIQRKIMPGGFAYIAVPVGKERVEFNAHRVFYAKTIIDSFFEMDLVEFSATDGNAIAYNVPVDRYDFDAVKGRLTFGLFCLKKHLN